MSFNPLSVFPCFQPLLYNRLELRSTSFHLLTNGSYRVPSQDTTFRIGSKLPSPSNSVVFCFFASDFRLTPIRIYSWVRTLLPELVIYALIPLALPQGARPVRFTLPFFEVIFVFYPRGLFPHLCSIKELTTILETE